MKSLSETIPNPSAGTLRGLLAAVLLLFVATADLALAGHGGGAIAERVNRFVGTIVAVGDPDAEGNIFSFESDIEGLAMNEIRSWRITFFSGDRYAHVFQVRDNVGGAITVTSLDGPLNGIAVGDMFLVEQINVTRPTPQMRDAAP